MINLLSTAHEQVGCRFVDGHRFTAWIVSKDKFRANCPETIHQLLDVARVYVLKRLIFLVIGAVSSDRHSADSNGIYLLGHRHVILHSSFDRSFQNHPHQAAATV